MNRPSFVSTVTALTLTDTKLKVTPFDDCVDVAEVLRDLERNHQGGPVKDVGADYWGLCSTCGERWPCPAWNDGELLAVQYLGRAQDRVAARAKTKLRPKLRVVR